MVVVVVIIIIVVVVVVVVIVVVVVLGSQAARKLLHEQLDLIVLSSDASENCRGMHWTARNVHSNACGIGLALGGGVVATSHNARKTPQT